MIPSVTVRSRYYADPAIQDRLGEFLGGEPPDHTSAVYFAIGTEWESRHQTRLSWKTWPASLEQGGELNRSLWDTRGLVAHLDIEYVNFDFPAHPYFATRRIFECQRPVIEVVQTILQESGIRSLHLLTGRGHHFVWRIDSDAAAFGHLRDMGEMTESLRRFYASHPAPTGETVHADLGAAFSGLGLVMEYLAQHIKMRSAPDCPIPVELGAIEAGGGRRGREVIAVDITEYADPLCSRVIRVPFSLYLKPWQQRHLLGEKTLARLAPIVTIPLEGVSLREGLKIRRNLEAVKELAPGVSTTIPEASRGMEAVIQKYRNAPLARFHAWFHSRDHEAESAWPATYDQTPHAMLPPCAAHILDHPNDLLLRPACVERVVRVLLSLGWHPRHIAGYVRSKYQHDHGWGDQWIHYDPATRADFYARVFTGLFVTGADDLVDFNCQSAREEGLCFIENCRENLAPFRTSLFNRKHYERLGCRPFNRLLLSKEHS